MELLEAVQPLLACSYVQDISFHLLRGKESRIHDSLPQFVQTSAYLASNLNAQGDCKNVVLLDASQLLLLQTSDYLHMPLLDSIEQRTPPILQLWTVYTNLFMSSQCVHIVHIYYRAMEKIKRDQKGDKN